MSRVDIYLKSGNVITIDVEEFSCARGRQNGELREMTWKLENPDDGNSPLYIDLAHVAAIVEAR